MNIKKDAFLNYERISFNQALLILNGELPTFDKYSDESFSSIFKPRKSKSEQIYKLRSEGNIELFEIESKEYSEQIRQYNLLVAKYDDNRPTTPTINTQEFLLWAVTNKLLNEPKATHQYKPSENNKSERIQRKSTTDQQNHINEIAKNIMLKYPNSTKTSLSVDVAKALENSLKPATIFKDYLKKYPNF